MKKMSIILSLCIALFLTGCAVTETATDASTKDNSLTKSEAIVTLAKPVALQIAKQRIINLGSAFNEGVIEGDVELLNIAFTKDVEIHYSVEGGAWKTVKAGFVKMKDTTSEIWHFNFKAFTVPNTGLWTSAACEFAIKYTVGGKTYWDNNNGSNYKISTSGSNPTYSEVILGTLNVKLYEANAYKNQWPAYANSLNYSVVIKNLNFTKKVTLVCSTDNWTTTYTQPLSFSKSLTGSDELWTINSLLALDITSLQFAIAYDVNGVTYWA